MRQKWGRMCMMLSAQDARWVGSVFVEAFLCYSHMVQTKFLYKQEVEEG